jgi:signal transduction histidine kinase
MVIGGPVPAERAMGCRHCGPPLREEAGAVTGVLATFGDATQHTQAEDATRRAEAAERPGVDIAELERASRLKSEYLATTSHEIRTSLTSILGLVDLLLRTPLDAEQHGYAITLRTAGDALCALVGDVLDFSKIEAGHLELKSQPFDPRQLVAEVMDTRRPQAAAKGLALVSLVESDVPAWLQGDAERLRQVLTNLLSNAVKFTERGNVVVGVRLKKQGDSAALGDRAADAATVELIVGDTGIGIAPEALPHLFDPFRQADAATARRYGGSGLGLAICRRLVTAMGGEIEVDSTLGVGSTFCVTVRLLLAEEGTPASSSRDAAPHPPREPGAGAPAAGREQGSGVSAVPDAQRLGRVGHILMAEDNPINQLVTRAMLEQLGYAVDTVENGREAVAAVVHRAYDLVLMDCHLPELDGYAATAAIRRAEAGAERRTPIIALTADARAEDAARCLAAGMDAYLAKPMTREALAAVVARWALV